MRLAKANLKHLFALANGDGLELCASFEGLHEDETGNSVVPEGVAEGEGMKAALCETCELTFMSGINLGVPELDPERLEPNGDGGDRESRVYQLANSTNQISPPDILHPEL